MTVLLKECRRDSTCVSHQELAVLTLLARVFVESWFKRFQKTRLSPTKSYLEGIGTADTEITSYKRGRVSLNGAWWNALSNSNMTIYPGQKVRVTSRQSNILLVELSPYV